MNARTKQVLTEAMALSEEERAAIAAELLASLDGEADEDAEAAWAVEIAERARRAIEGVGTATDIDESLARAEARLRAASR